MEYFKILHVVLPINTLMYVFKTVKKKKKYQYCHFAWCYLTLVVPICVEFSPLVSKQSVFAKAQWFQTVSLVLLTILLFTFL